MNARLEMLQSHCLDRNGKYISEHVYLANVIRSIVEIKTPKCLNSFKIHRWQIK